MAAKIVFNFLLAFCVFQELVAAEVNGGDNSRSVIDNVIEDTITRVSDEIENVLSKVAKARDEEGQRIISFLDVLHEKERDLLVESQEALKKLVAKVAQDVAVAKKNATGVDIVDCIVRQEDAAKKLAEDTALKITTCVTDKVKEGEEMTKELYRSVLSVGKLFEVTARNFSKCLQVPGRLDVLTCLFRVSFTVTTQAVEIEESIVQELRDVQSFLEHVVMDITTCVNSNLLQAEERVGQILSDIASCVYQRLEPNVSVHTKL